VLGSKAATTVADILPRPVTLSGLAAQDKTYDGSTTATLAAASIGGLVPGESLTIAAQATFSDKNVGPAKPVSGSFALGDGAGGGLAANYQFSGPTTFSGSAAIDPRPLAVTAATASGKVYDSTVAASVGNFVLGGVLPGEQVRVTAGSGQFDNANVGTNKAVQATATTLGGADAGNYRLGSPSFGTFATITPATLSYVAAPTALPVGTPIGELPGSVAGFVGTDTLRSATTGTPSFTSTATANSPEGLYPVTGSGLRAGNYVFVQAALNARALSLVNLPPALLDDVAAQLLITPQFSQVNLPSTVVSSVSAHRSADVRATATSGHLRRRPGRTRARPEPGRRAVVPDGRTGRGRQLPDHRGAQAGAARAHPAAAGHAGACRAAAAPPPAAVTPPPPTGARGRAAGTSGGVAAARATPAVAAPRACRRAARCAWPRCRRSSASWRW
jgi:hypothetical protein